MYIIKSGKALIINELGTEKVFLEIRPGDFFGESKVIKQPVSVPF